MTLCKYCGNIDPDAIQEEMKGHDEQPRVVHHLQPSHLMQLSAQNGCSGCRFFLDVLEQETRELHDLGRQIGFRSDYVEATGEFLRRDQPIWIEAPFRLATYGIAIIPVPIPIRIVVDICLVQAEHDPNFAAPHSGPYKPILQDPSSQACMDLAKGWLAKCAAHEDCPPQAAVPLPTRLIEILKEGQDCRLHISAPGEKGHYITLSHCWGSTVTSSLQTANLVEFQRVIHIENLSRSFQDAISITRRLGFRFLWIDAICIVQDSIEDWAQESSLMAGIYRNGSLMISAMAAPDGQHGILSPRKNLRSHHFGRNNEFLFQTRSKSYFSHEMDPDEPLRARGWCLQEYIMAPRILHFGKKKLIWECVSQRWAEDFGLADIPSGVLGGIEARPESMPFIWPPRKGLEEEHQVERLAAFYRCVSEYTERKLTRSSDKLPALSGLASAFQTPELGAYLAGLWEKDLVRGLNWYTQTARPRKGPEDCEEYIAPSWSWASIPGACELRYIRADLSFSEEAEHEHFDSTLKPQLLSYHIELATPDTYGKISAASITLRGYIRPIILRPYPPGTVLKEPRGAVLDHERGSDFHSSYVWMFGPPHEFVPWADLKEWDTPPATHSNETRQFIAMPVGMCSNYSEYPNMMLVMLILGPVEGLEDTYRRVGRVEVVAPSEIDPVRWEQKDLTLI